ncbi:AbrB/MazE/SpoVT family DNA-binding domain-containing protein [Candidatus Daviesbacteria bacterium]|nr:AbrB/MazE/SpoVT family DNA-binding domain-containing protein [Candidatus Daviesbacteria bacterium]
MQATISITNKWQLHIPKAARIALKLTKPGKVEARVENNTLILTPTKSKILEVAGKYQHLYKKHPIDIDNVRAIIDYSNL